MIEQYSHTCFSSRSLSYGSCRERLSLTCNMLEGDAVMHKPQVKRRVLEVCKMKVFKNLSSNILASGLAAAVLVLAPLGAVHAEGGAERLIDLRSKTDYQDAAVTQPGLSMSEDLQEYYAEDGSERLRKLFSDARQS